MMNDRWHQELQSIASDYVIGVDECGNGSIAGPIVVCAVGARKDWYLPGLNDSKKLSAKKREAMVKELDEQANAFNIEYAIVQRSHKVIDQIGIWLALLECYQEAIGRVMAVLEANNKTHFTVILDGEGQRWSPDRPNAVAKSIPKADGFVPTVMAASILAKVCRDTQMTSLHQIYPNYHWNKNKGYLTTEHRAALEKFGASPLHRQSFEPIKSMVKE